MSCNERIAVLLSKAVAPEKLAKAFITVCDEELNLAGQNLIRVMSENGRLTVFPDGLKQFILLRSAQEVTVTVDVIYASILKEKQLETISSAMKQRLSRKVKLNCKIDKTIVAGIIIRIGNMLIDSSVRGRLERLTRSVLQF
ncbi:ATP synthase subunit delta [Candidatus Doolittlea endobia]|uniref:ATP synthase subunit delta n=1 Tax=Candidatus Doolittlea endobia TaxID=1778262 RepID=A0A143WV55_9ENTR|nr:ATP synthase subunit delta [Candidatus Doolittlea endobia]